MGAGSAKGIRKAPDGDDPDGDAFSVTSDQWGDDDPVKESSPLDNNNKIIKADVNPGAGPSNAGTSDTRMEVEKKEEAKRRGIFAFAKKKDDNGKVDDIVNELSNSDSNKDNNKKEGGEKKGFNLFGWKRGEKRTEAEGEESGEKDKHIDQDINELEKTFDSLGIVGQNKWPKDTKSSSADDIEHLEPMRNRKQLKTRTVRSLNGVNTGDDSSTSSGNRRTFKYSWEMNEVAPVHDDEWEYQAVVIEGFDIDKFKRANMDDALVFENNIANTLPNAVKHVDPYIENNDDRGGAKYDLTEQQILASIERDFAI